MADPKKNLSAADAKKQAVEAINADAKRVTLERQPDGKWTLTVVEAG